PRYDRVTWANGAPTLPGPPPLVGPPGLVGPADQRGPPASAGPPARQRAWPVRAWARATPATEAANADGRAWRRPRGPGGKAGLLARRPPSACGGPSAARPRDRMAGWNRTTRRGSAPHGRSAGGMDLTQRRRTGRSTSTAGRAWPAVSPTRSRRPSARSARGRRRAWGGPRRAGPARPAAATRPEGSA